MLETLGVKVGKIEVQLIKKSDRICKKLLSGVGFEKESLIVWGDICSPGGTVLDIGAYTGLYAIAAALAGCEVIAFEPVAENWKRCLENREENGVNVTFRNEAVSDHVGTIKLSINPHVMGLTTGASVLHYSGGNGRQEIKRTVKTVTIDSLDFQSLTAMKIDVERAEPMVLRGAQETLQRCRPTLIIEVLGEDEKDAVRAAVPFYRVKREMDERNWLMVPR